MKKLLLKKNYLGRASGFTLFELIVVLTIITIVSFVILTILKPRSNVRNAVEGLIHTMEAAKKEALLRPATLGLQLSLQGYRYYEYDYHPGGKSVWRALSHDRLSKPYGFKQLRALSITLNGRQTPVKKAMILFGPSAEITPFEITLQAKEHTYKITNETGDIRVSTQ